MSYSVSRTHFLPDVPFSAAMEYSVFPEILNYGILWGRRLGSQCQLAKKAGRDRVEKK